MKSSTKPRNTFRYRTATLYLNRCSLCTAPDFCKIGFPPYLLFSDTEFLSFIPSWLLPICSLADKEDYEKNSNIWGFFPLLLLPFHSLNLQNKQFLKRKGKNSLVSAQLAAILMDESPFWSSNLFWTGSSSGERPCKSAEHHPHLWDVSIIKEKEN